jgi:enoyl-CoA hydratase/carnithine racemase
MSLRRDLRRGVLSLTLDTPGAVNVITRDAAAALRDCLLEVDPAVVRAVVLRSGKPGSFVNGASLMLAGTVKSVEDAARLTGPVRDAYRAIRDCPAPTVCAIRGNCYGCGVELALQCQYRVASDERDTHFYMTELADYLLIPTFGATQDLPRLLGLEGATDFLLWGERWPARRAFDRGLVDACFDPDVFEQEIETFVDAVTRPGGNPPRPTRRASTASELDGIRARTSERIRRLPPAYRELYATCFELMTAAFTQGGDGREREAVAAVHSALKPQSKAATPFFFLRQMGRSLALAGCPEETRKTVSFAAADVGLRPLCAELAAGVGENSTTNVLRMIPYVAGDGSEGSGHSGQVAVSRGLGQRFDGRSGVVMHAPFRGAGIDVAEVTCGGVAFPEQQVLSAALADRYFTVLQTRPKRRFVLDDLFLAWVMPQIEYLTAGGSPADLAESLRTFGFMRLPGDGLSGLDSAALDSLLREGAADRVDALEAFRALPKSTCEGGADDPIVMQAVLASLGGLVARMLRDQSLRHVTFADVAARDVLDFPLQHTSLCRHLTPTRCRDLLRSAPTFRRLVPADNLFSFEEFAARGRAFYQGHAAR